MRGSIGRHVGNKALVLCGEMVTDCMNYLIGTD